jgi:hypothetical protein
VPARKCGTANPLTEQNAAGREFTGIKGFPFFTKHLGG